MMAKPYILDCMEGLYFLVQEVEQQERFILEVWRLKHLMVELKVEQDT